MIKKQEIMMIFLVFLLSLHQAANATSTITELSKIETISIRIFTDFGRKGSLEFRKSFNENFKLFGELNFVNITQKREDIYKEKDSLIWINVSLKEDCSQDDIYCAFAIFPESIWSGGNLPLHQCRLVKIFEDGTRTQKPNTTSRFIIEHLKHCILNEINEVRSELKENQEKFRGRLKH